MLIKMDNMEKTIFYTDIERFKLAKSMQEEKKKLFKILIKEAKKIVELTPKEVEQMRTSATNTFENALFRKYKKLVDLGLGFDDLVSVKKINLTKYKKALSEYWSIMVDETEPLTIDQFNVYCNNKAEVDLIKKVRKACSIINKIHKEYPDVGIFLFGKLNGNKSVV